MSYTSFVDVLIILERDEHVLLAQRAGTGYADGQWNLPSGKLEDGEDMVAAIIRETREEIDVEVDRDDLEMVTSVHYLNPEGQARVGFFFRTRQWRGELRNAEPHKCSQIAWFPNASLPANTVPYTHAGVELYRRGERFGLQGWPPPAGSVLAGR
ncbi:NUDIX hydrolase [Amycolatopsis plumensis]|uniref:NUDIX domain-containing protein n=1 Tax=Amycolatopsis plumensis TaxID=236508 RepID=A0ABV5U3W2_9PSEU